MIQKFVDFALKNRFLVLAIVIMLFVWGGISFHNLPVDAYPDVADNYVNIITQWPGHSAEDIEKQITVPCEIAMAGIPDMKNLRSFSLAGISSIMMNFNDDSDNSWNRERVLERLSSVTLPSNLVPQLQTDWSPAGQIYWYTIESKNPTVDVMEQKAIEDWTLEKQFKNIPGVVDVASSGGTTKEYQIRLNPDTLISYGLSIAQVEQQLQTNNTNAGGSFIVAGSQQINVQAQGLYETIQQIEDTLIKTQGGTPIRVKDIAEVEQGPKIRLGQISKAFKPYTVDKNGVRHYEDGKIIDNQDVVEGVVLLKKGADADPVLKKIEDKVKELNDQILPKGVKVVPFLDRSELVHLTTHTVLHNLTEGIVLVSIILILFLGNVRGAIIVAVTIPFALLFASICLDLSHIPANLLSLGALDFGMVVDGAVVMVENIVRHLARKNGTRSVQDKIKEAAHEVQRPVFYAIAIIITAYLPIFTLQSVGGRLFKPLAWTVAFALLGAMLFSVVVTPVLSSILFRRGAKEWHNPVMEFLKTHYKNGAAWAIHHRWITLGASVAGFVISIVLLSSVIGSEFLPHLDEGSLWVRGTLPMSTGPDASLAISNKARLIMASFPEVTDVVDQIGRPDDGTDWTGFFDTEYNVNLKPKEQWRPVFHQDKDALIASMNQQLENAVPSVIWGFSQPIEDNMEEAVSGVKGELSVKIYGDDFTTLGEKGNEVVNVMSKIPGVADLGLLPIIGQPNLTFTVDRQAAARWGINVADIQDAIQTAVGGTVLSEVLKGEAQYDLVLRYQKQFRDTREAIENVRLLAPTGERVSLAQLTRIGTTDGAEEIYREGEQRYIAVKYSVRGRDLGGAVEEAISTVTKLVPLPKGYHYVWAGEYESKQRADRRLALIVPLTVALIAMILFTMFKSFKWAGLILVNVALAPVGGALALLVTGTNISVSSSVGFLALFGVSVQTGVIMLEYINQLRARGYTVEGAAIEGAVLRLRPIMMTMLVATLGLLPAALSHGIGSDSQRPFAIVIVGGLMVDLILSIFLLPTLYVWVARDTDKLPAPEGTLDV